MATKGCDAGEVLEGHYYLPLPMHGFFVQVSRSARVAH